MATQIKTLNYENQTLFSFMGEECKISEALEAIKTNLGYCRKETYLNENNTMLLVAFIEMYQCLKKSLYYKGGKN